MYNHDQDLYRSAFSHVQPQTEIRWEDMERRAQATRFKRVKPAIWAAVVALMVLMSIAVVAVGLLSLRELQLTHNAYPDIPGDIMTLAGLVDTPEYQAANEWESYLETLDLAAIAAEADKHPPLPEQYTNYSCYNEDMREKLDSIAEKYGLQLHQRSHTFYRQPITDRQGVSLVGAEHTAETGYFYDDGTFSVSGRVLLTDRGEVSYNLYSHQKGLLSDVTFNAGDMNQYEQWQYAANGADLLLALGPDRSIIIWDSPEALVTVVILGGSHTGDAISTGYLQAKHVEHIADGIYFDRLPQIALEGVPETPAPDFPDDQILQEQTGISYAMANAFLAKLEQNAKDNDLDSFASILMYPCLVTTPEGSFTASDPKSFLAQCNAPVSSFLTLSPTSFGAEGYFPKNGLAGTQTGAFWLYLDTESVYALQLSTAQTNQDYTIRPAQTGITAG